MSRPKKKQDKPKPDAASEAVEKPKPPPNRIVRDGTPSARVIPDVSDDRTERTVPKHRRCPLCWGRDKGMGFSDNSNSTDINIDNREEITTTRTIRRYKCDCCSFDWKIKVIKQIFPLDHCEIDVENREVRIDTRVSD